MTSIGDEDLRLLASCLGSDASLFDEVYSQCQTGSMSSDPTAAAVAKYIMSRTENGGMERVLQQLRGATIMSVSDVKASAQLCLTMPSWLHMSAFASTVVTTEVAMVNVILHARHSLKLAFPFIDAASKDVLRQLEYAWRRGCSVQILCRDIGNLEGLRLDPEFVDALRKGQHGAACRVPAYVDNVKWTFHAKVLIADEVSAYVGSANLTKASLMDQAEVGILITDPLILRDLRAWYSSLWSALVHAD